MTPLVTACRRRDPRPGAGARQGAIRVSSRRPSRAASASPRLTGRRPGAHATIQTSGRPRFLTNLDQVSRVDQVTEPGLGEHAFDERLQDASSEQSICNPGGRAAWRLRACAPAPSSRPPGSRLAPPSCRRSEGRRLTAGTEQHPMLSSRQREILSLLSDGQRARAISTQLGLSEATVRNHIRVLLRKLECHSQLEAVAKARRQRLV